MELLTFTGPGRNIKKDSEIPMENTGMEMVNGMLNTTSSPKVNDAHLRAIIQSEKKWKHQFFRRLRVEG